MCVAEATREQKSFEGGLQRLEFKKQLASPFSDDFLSHTPRWLILSAGSFSYSPMLLYMGSLSCLTHPVLVYAGSTSCMPPCWFIIIWGVSLTCPLLVYMGSFSYMPSAGLLWSFSYTPHAGFFLLGISLIKSMLASLCREFLLYKTKRKNVKVNKNVHN